MTTARLEPAPAETAPEAPGRVPYRLSAEEYLRALEAGVFAPGRRVALWEGGLYEAMARKLAHSVGYSKLIVAIVRACPPGWCVWSDSPILLDDFSAPLPDLALVRGEHDDYARRNSVPKAAEIGLVVEVSDATLRRDLTSRLGVYARAGIATYWVVNLVSRRVEVYSRPAGEGESWRYESSATYGPGEDVPLSLDGREAGRVAAADLLPGVET